jgi:hypothetical protein
MGYEVPIGTVDRRRRQRDVPAVLAAACLVVAVAAGASSLEELVTGRDVASPSAPPVEAAVAAERREPRNSPGPSIRPRPLPLKLDCRDLERADCVRVAKAALAVLPPDTPRVTAATAWRSLLCGDVSDCPASHLARSKPLGSLVVAFVDGSPGAAVNVVERRFGANIRLGTLAWLLDWEPSTPAD